MTAVTQTAITHAARPLPYVVYIVMYGIMIAINCRRHDHIITRLDPSAARRNLHCILIVRTYLPLERVLYLHKCCFCFSFFRSIRVYLFVTRLDLWPFRSHVYIGDRAFGVAASRVWNSLPPVVTSASSLPSFKKQLKTFLFRNSFP